MRIRLSSTASKKRRTTPGAASKESFSSVDEELCSVWHVRADEQPHLPLAVHTWARRSGEANIPGGEGDGAGAGGGELEGEGAGGLVEAGELLGAEGEVAVAGEGDLAIAAAELDGHGGAG
jgi:hypothetical protein